MKQQGGIMGSNDIKTMRTSFWLFVIIVVLIASLVVLSLLQDGVYKEGYLCRFKYAKYIEPTLDQNFTGFGFYKTVTNKCDETAIWFTNRGLGASDRFINIQDLKIEINGS